MYKQLKEITIKALFEEGACEGEWTTWLIDHGFIEKEQKWRLITMRDLHKIRSGVTLKRIIERYESIIHVTSDPYWSIWQGTPLYLQHILVFGVKRGSGHGNLVNGFNEYSINDLFNGDVYIKE